MRAATVDNDERNELLEAARGGDERAFRGLVEPHRAALELHCYRMLGSPHDAEDLTQETLLRAWRSLDRFESRSRVGTWLYRIATNACLDELERRPRVPEPVLPFPEEKLELAAPAASDPEARYAEREGVELAFLTAIQKLPGRQRAVLILRDVLGWSATEAAELLDSTVASVNSSLQRARSTIDADLPRGAPKPNQRAERELAERYVDAWQRVDVDEIVSLLRDDAVLRMPPQPSVAGAREIVGFFMSTSARRGIAAIDVELRTANGRPVMVMRRRTPEGLERHGLLMLEGDGKSIAGLAAFIDEDLVELFERAA
jgi:RNA polymerase sigma-70 factor (ECF subfamily)